VEQPPQDNEKKILVGDDQLNTKTRKKPGHRSWKKKSQAKTLGEDQ